MLWKDVMKDSQDERKVNRKLIPMLFRKGFEGKERRKRPKERKGKEVKPQLQRRRLRRRRLTRRWKKCNPVRKKKRQLRKEKKEKKDDKQEDRCQVPQAFHSKGPVTAMKHSINPWKKGRIMLKDCWINVYHLFSGIIIAVNK